VKTVPQKTVQSHLISGYMGILIGAYIIIKERQASFLQLASLLQIKLLSVWATDR
jgi:hypothetical protein